MSALPYVSSPGNVEKALRGIRTAATPDRVSQDFVKTMLKIPGGSGDQVTAYLKKVGFTNTDGSPSDLYKKFRNATNGGVAASEALKLGYAPLYKRNEYMHRLSDDKLRGLIIEETGQKDDSSVVGLVLGCIKGLNKFAAWNQPDIENLESVSSLAIAAQQNGTSAKSPMTNGHTGRLGLSLAYTINLNLPATSDVAVFNAIFKSLKENLLKDSHE